MAITTARRATNVSLDANIVAEAKELGVNVSRACEKGLLADLREARAKRWQVENREMIDACNKWVREHGLPLEEYRMF